VRGRTLTKRDGGNQNPLPANRKRSAAGRPANSIRIGRCVRAVDAENGG